MALTESDYLEVNGLPMLEVVRVESTADTGDTYTSKKFQKIKGVNAQNHGATFATGVARDSPKLVITQGSATANATVEIQHSAATEVFSLFIWGEH